VALAFDKAVEVDLQTTCSNPEASSSARLPGPHLTSRSRPRPSSSSSAAIEFAITGGYASRPDA
jgi:hypothetical protein